MDIGTLLPLLALTTLVVVCGVVLYAKLRTDKLRKANPRTSTLASDVADERGAPR